MKKMIAIIWYVAKHYKDALPTNEVKKKKKAENTCRVMWPISKLFWLK